MGWNRAIVISSLFFLHESSPSAKVPVEVLRAHSAFTIADSGPIRLQHLCSVPSEPRVVWSFQSRGSRAIDLVLEQFLMFQSSLSSSRFLRFCHLYTWEVRAVSFEGIIYVPSSKPEEVHHRHWTKQKTPVSWTVCEMDALIVQRN